MKADESAQSHVIEGHFLRAEAQRARRYTLPLLIVACVLAAAAVGLRAPLLAVAAIAVGAAALLFAARRRQPKLVTVGLADAVFRVYGDGYDLLLAAPFRYKTGVERILATEQQDERCFVRMVIDVHGKPLVLEEQVPAGYYPPQLDEIVGKASALGVAELTSLSPYPGALWSLIEALESLTEAEPAAKLEENVESLYRIGRQQLADEDYHEAIETFSALIRMRPDSAAAYYSRGSARYHARADLDRAVNDLTTALRLEPHQYKAYRMRGLARAQQGDWAGLRDDCSLALKYYPNSAELHNLRGTACYRLQDFAAALASFEEAVRLDANRHESYYNRGLAKQRQGKLAEAIEDFQHALNLNPAFVEGQRNLQASRRQLARRQSKSPS